MSMAARAQNVLSASDNLTLPLSCILAYGEPIEQVTDDDFSTEKLATVKLHAKAEPAAQYSKHSSHCVEAAVSLMILAILSWSLSAKEPESFSIPITKMQQAIRPLSIAL